MQVTGLPFQIAAALRPHCDVAVHRRKKALRSRWIGIGILSSSFAYMGVAANGLGRHSLARSS